MSYEVWGDGDDEHFEQVADRLIDNGWWDEDTVERVKDAVQKLRSETLYAGGRMQEGVSHLFLARITILSAEVGILKEDDPLVIEAREILGEPK
jgi:hypothetical protein